MARVKTFLDYTPKEIRYIERRALDQAELVLGYSSSNINDNESQRELFKTFNKILKSSTSQTFQESVIKSEECHKQPEKLMSALENLTLNNANSFVIAPIFAIGHVFSSTIRKTDEGFSVVLSNKGSRGNHKIHEMYIVKQENLEKLVKTINEVSVFRARDLYDELNKYAAQSSGGQLHINSSGQKRGNCFIKGVEAGIKYAFATRNIAHDQIPSIQKIKWSPSTEEIHKLYIEEMKLQNPTITHRLTSMFDAYIRNKHFRNSVQKGLEPVDSYKKAFGTSTKMEEVFKKLDMVSFQRCNRDIEKLVMTYNDKELSRAFSELKDFTNYRANAEKYVFDPNFEKSVDELSKTFPLVVKQAQDSYRSMVSGLGSKFAEKGAVNNAIKAYDKAIEISPSNSEAFYARGQFYSKLGKLDKAEKDYTQAIEIAECYRVCYLKRGQIYNQLGEKDKAIEDFKKAIKLEPRLTQAKNELVKTLLERGYENLAKKECSKALDDASFVLKLEPENKSAKQLRFEAQKSKNITMLKGNKSMLELQI